MSDLNRPGMSDDVVERARMVLRNDPGACTADTVAKLLNEIEHLHAEIEALRAALEASVRLQSHYAWLLNEHDDGGRMTFDDADAWMAWIYEPPSAAPTSTAGSAAHE